MTVGENIARLRKARGLSQEQLARKLDITRQAVTKWENNRSQPSTENLIRLAELLEVDMNELVGPASAPAISTGRAPGIFLGLGAAVVAAYTLAGLATDRFSAGTLICALILLIPIGLFLHLYYSSAVKSGDFTLMAGYDGKVEMVREEVKRVLVRMDFHLSAVTMVFIMLLCAAGLAGLHLEGLFILLYTFEFGVTVLIINVRSMDKVYKRELDARRGRTSMLYSLIVFAEIFASAGIMLAPAVFGGIGRDDPPVLRQTGLLLLEIVLSCIALFYENSRLSRWDGEGRFRLSRLGIVCFAMGALCVMGMLFC